MSKSNAEFFQYWRPDPSTFHGAKFSDATGKYPDISICVYEVDEGLKAVAVAGDGRILPLKVEYQAYGGLFRFEGNGSDFTVNFENARGGIPLLITHENKNVWGKKIDPRLMDDQLQIRIAKTLMNGSANGSAKNRRQKGYNAG